MRFVLTTLLIASLAAGARAQTLSGLCTLSTSHSAAAAEVTFRSSDCEADRHNCSMSNHSDMPWTRWSGVSPETLTHDGAQLKASMLGDPGDLICSGTVHNGVLTGKYEFTPDPAFARNMTARGFTETTPQQDLGFLMLDVSLRWIDQIRSLGVTGLTTDQLMGLKALGVDAAYIRAISAAGLPELRADKLIAMKAVGVTPDTVKEAKSLGFQPSEEDLMQMCIFKIDRPFVERMKAKGLTDLTLAKLIKIRIFKLDE